MQKSKESTSRITMWRELEIPNVYTMEASFCGNEIDKLKNFTCSQYTQIGKELCRALLYYFDIKTDVVPFNPTIPPINGKKL